MENVNTGVVADSCDGLGMSSRMYCPDYFHVFEIRRESITSVQLFIKRVIDIVGALFALALISPIVPIIAIAVKSDSSGPLFYQQKRVGKKGKVFTLYKFRTMIEGADKFLDILLPMNERTGLLFKMANDPRATRVGRFLRRYSLDELPQLWNVVKGDMSLVGPRPPVISEYEQYQGDYFRRLYVVPGITGLWQVHARRDPSTETYLALDLEYIDNWSLWLDLSILLQTVVVVAAGTGQ